MCNFWSTVYKRNSLNCIPLQSQVQLPYEHLNVLVTMIHCVRLETQRSAQVESRDDMSRFHFLFCYFLCSVHCLVYKNALQALCHQIFFYQTDLTRFLSLEFFTTRFDKISLVTLFHFDTVFPYFSKGIRKTFFLYSLGD